MPALTTMKPEEPPTTADTFLTEIVRICYTVRMRVTTGPTTENPPVTRTLIAGQNNGVRMGLEATSHNLQSFFIFLSVAAIVVLVVSLVVFVPQVMEKYGVSFRRKNEDNKRSDSIEWHCAPDATLNHPAREPVPDAENSTQEPPPQTVSRLQKVMRACCCVRNVHLESKHAIRFLIESLHKPRRDEDIVNCFHPDIEEPQLQDAQSNGIRQTGIFGDPGPISDEIPQSPVPFHSSHSSKDIIVDVENYALPRTLSRDNIKTVNFEDENIGKDHDHVAVGVHDEGTGPHRTTPPQMERSLTPHGSPYNKQSVKAKRKLFSGSHHNKGDRRTTQMKHTRKLLRRMKRSSAAKCIVSSDSAATENSSMDTVVDIHHQTMETSVDTIIPEDLEFEKGHVCLTKDSGYYNEAMEQSVEENEEAVEHQKRSIKATVEETNKYPVRELGADMSQGESLECKMDIHLDKFDTDKQFWESTL